MHRVISMTELSHLTMKLLLDQGLPRSAAILLGESGLDTIHVADRSLSAAEDSEIIAAAKAENRIVITLDADFHALLALTGASSPSVIRIFESELKDFVQLR